MIYLDILKEIKSEHDEFRKLITKIEKAADSKKKSLFDELNIKIHAHHEAEEQVLFIYFFIFFIIYLS